MNTADTKDGKPLLNESENNKFTTEGGNEEKRKSRKKVIIGLVIGLAIIGVILAIVLPLTLKGKEPNNPPTPPPPSPVDPFIHAEFNAYTIDDTSVVQDEATVSFQAKQNPPKESELKNFAKFFSKDSEQLQDTTEVYSPVDPTTIPNIAADNSNNKWAKVVQVTCLPIKSNVLHMTVGSTDLPSYQVSNDIWTPPTKDDLAKISDMSVLLDAKKFQLTIGKSAKSGNPTINTLNRKLLVSSKYSEMGLIVPTRRLFGLGQRNGKLALDSGSYTLLARGRKEYLPAEDYLGGKQGNHIHPFVMGQSDDGSFFGIFFPNAGVQHFEIIHFTDYSNSVINYIHLGSSLDMYFMFGTATEVIA